MHIGLIGLGKMGANMRERLRAGGIEVTGFDRNPAVTDVATLADLAAALPAGERIVWVVRRMEIDFVQPARIDDVLTVETRAASISGARIVMAQELKRGEDLLVRARVEAAIIGEGGRPKRFPKEWIAAFMPAKPVPSS